MIKIKDEKIFDEEILSDEELEKISGGSYTEKLGDTSFLKEYGHMNCTLDYKSSPAAWASEGIRCVADPNYRSTEPNKYFLKGQEISRKEAFKHVLRNRGWNDVDIEHFNFEDYRF